MPPSAAGGTQCRPCLCMCCCSRLNGPGGTRGRTAVASPSQHPRRGSSRSDRDEKGPSRDQLSGDIHTCPYADQWQEQVAAVAVVTDLVTHGEKPGARDNLCTRKHFRIIILQTGTMNKTYTHGLITAVVIVITVMVPYKCRRRVTKLGMTLISRFSCFFLPLRRTAPPRSMIKHIWVVSPTPYRSLPSSMRCTMNLHAIRLSIQPTRHAKQYYGTKNRTW